MNISLVGAGQRGMTYARFAYHVRKMEIKAVVEPNEERRNIAAEEFHIPKEYCYRSAEEFWKAGKVSDLLIIASMDRDHYRQTMAALDLDYDILLEKPISPDVSECAAIKEKADAKKRKVVICHVLRYTAFFSKIKEILDSGVIGKIITINHSENIGNFHIAHSFVRGNWRNSSQSSPLIVQKSCHDMDILYWLVGSNAKSISSFGGLTYFKEENAPEGSTGRCLECPVAKDCRFDARKQYLPVAGNWPAALITPSSDPGDVLEGLKTSPYGRCVYRCDNDVCDHQSTIIEFENGVTATFSLSGFTNRVHRSIHIMCEDGEILGDDEDNKIYVTRFSSNGAEEYKTEVYQPAKPNGGHNGGDENLMDDFLNKMQERETKSRSDISQSLESHLMAHGAELSRVKKSVIDISELKVNLRDIQTEKEGKGVGL